MFVEFEFRQFEFLNPTRGVDIWTADVMHRVGWVGSREIGSLTL